MKKVLILIPTYDEADNVAPLTAAITKVMSRQRKQYVYDMLFIDDRSPDGTADSIRSLQTARPEIHLLSGDKAGLGRAYIRGMQWGLDRGGYDACVMMDADLSHDPADIPRLLKALDGGADYVIGSRYAPGGRVASGYSPVRHLQSLAANRIAATLLDARTPVRDLTAGFKAIRMDALALIPLESIAAAGYVFQVCLLYAFLRRGYQVREVATTFSPRRHGSSKLGWKDVAEFLLATYGLNSMGRLQCAVRFIAVGASGTVVNIAILLSLIHLAGLDPRAAYVAALEGSILSNFVLNHLFTFRNGRSSGAGQLARKLAGYNLVSLLGATIAWATFTVATSRWGLHYVAADILGIILATGWNYWLSLKVVWPLVDNELPETGSSEPQQI